MADLQNPIDRAAHLRALAASWTAERRRLGARPRQVGRRRPDWRPWDQRDDAAAGALALADELEHGVSPSAVDAVQSDAVLEERAVALRRAGLTFAAVARTLGVPIGSAKTWCRRARLAQGGAA